MTINSDGLKDLFLFERIQVKGNPNPAARQINPAINQHRPGVYGEVDRAGFGVELVPAKTSQHRRLSMQSEFVYYLPFLPLAICPDAPDVMAEYVQTMDIWIKVTHWSIDHQLVPSLIKREINTANIFGLPVQHAWGFFNFANGIIIRDTKSNAVYRILVQPQPIIEPAVSMARPAEKLLANRVVVHTFAVQTTDHLYSLLPDTKNPKQFRVVQQPRRDVELWRMMMLYNQSMDGTI